MGSHAVTVRQGFFGSENERWDVARATMRSGIDAIVKGESRDNFALQGTRSWPRGDQPDDRDQRLRTTWDIIGESCYQAGKVPGADHRWNAISEKISSFLTSKSNDPKFCLTEEDNLFRTHWKNKIETPITELLRKRLVADSEPVFSHAPTSSDTQTPFSEATAEKEAEQKRSNYSRSSSQEASASTQQRQRASGQRSGSTSESTPWRFFSNFPTWNTRVPKRSHHSSTTAQNDGVDDPNGNSSREDDKAEQASFISRYWKPALSLVGLAAGTYALYKTFGNDDGE